MLAPVQVLFRKVAEDIAIRGVDIPAGSMVEVRFGAANRDPQQYPQPDAIDLKRANAQSHLAFGAGPHFCAGAAVSRTMIADVALPGVFARLKGLSLDDSEPVRIGGWAFRGLQNLPVAWDAA